MEVACKLTYRESRSLVLDVPAGMWTGSDQRKRVGTAGHWRGRRWICTDASPCTSWTLTIIMSAPTEAEDLKNLHGKAPGSVAVGDVEVMNSAGADGAELEHTFG